MSKWDTQGGRWVRWGATALAALILTCVGCETGSEDETASVGDSSGVDGYFASNPPYDGSDIGEPETTQMSIAPSSYSISIVDQQVAFVASGGEGDYSWSLSDTANGTLTTKGANQAVYSVKAIGNNSVIVQDAAGHYAIAYILPVTDSMTLTPVGLDMLSTVTSAGFAVSGGTPPYTWSVANPALGTVTYSSGSSYEASYTRVSGAAGVNVITVTDAEGRTASATITQL